MAVLPIVTYNDPILRKKAEPVKNNTDDLQQLIEDMFETMHNSEGVGLAAPQIGKSLCFFVIDADPMAKSDEEKSGPMVFINPEIIERKGKNVSFEEGCLSIPDVMDKVIRPDEIVIRFLDRNFKKKESEFNGVAARVIQHEYDHLEGILFIDHLSAFRKRFHKAELADIDSGIKEVRYPVVPKAL